MFAVVIQDPYVLNGLQVRILNDVDKAVACAKIVVASRAKRYGGLVEHNDCAGTSPYRATVGGCVTVQVVPAEVIE